MSEARSALKHSAPQSGMFGRGPFGGVGIPSQRARDFRGTTRRLAGYLRPHSTVLLVVILAAIVSTVLSVISPKLLGMVTTRIFQGYLNRTSGSGPGVDFGYVGRMLSMLVGFYVVSALFLYLQQYLVSAVAQRTVYALRKDVDEKFGRLPLRFFDARTHGELLSRVVNDLDNISSTLQQNVTQLITASLSVIGIIVMMLTISWIMTLVVLGTLPLSVVLVTRIAKRSQGYFVRQQQALGELNGHVAEMYAGHTVVTAFGHEDRAIARFTELNAAYYQGAWRAQFATGLMYPVMMFVSNLSYVAVAVIGGYLVTVRGLAIGDVQAFIQYSRQFSMPITQLSTMANAIQLTVASAERVFELLDEPEEPADVVLPAGGTDRPARADVVFDHVSFRYNPDEPLIEDLNMHVHSGQTIAIVGPTGAGKTTLVNLLMRFYDIQDGRIIVGGDPVTQVPRGVLRRRFGMVLQDTWLFSGTIRENIAYGRLDATNEEIVAAATAAQADHFIRTLPDNYDTVVHEEASNLSHGQRQLLTIARAFLADPAILILDEATSSVDTRTEMLIQQAMAGLMRGRTTFVIAHRLSTVSRADVILMMEHGRIVESGTHAELLAAGGPYAALYQSQFAGGLTSSRDTGHTTD